MQLEDFVVNSNVTALEALKKIDLNKKGFLVVLSEGIVVGTLTDGDIRRGLIIKKLSGVHNSIENIYSKDFKYIKNTDDFSKVVEAFKNEKFNFLPILNHEKHLCNIITKGNLHALLLQDIKFDLNYKFLEIDDMIPEHEIFSRPWGFYKTAILNQYYQCKTIVIKPSSSLSLQQHLRREEHWVVVHGIGEAQIGKSIIPVTSGSYLFIPKECIHRLKNTSEHESLIITEVQLGDYFGEDDIIRFEDDYGRI